MWFNECSVTSEGKDRREEGWASKRMGKRGRGKQTRSCEGFPADEELIYTTMIMMR